MEVFNKTGTTELSVIAGEGTATTTNPVAEADGVDCAAVGGYVIVNIPTAADGGCDDLMLAL